MRTSFIEGIVLNSMRRLAAIFFLPVVLMAQSATAAPEPPKELQLFLLIGQSNMAGRGVVEPRDQTPIPHVWMLTKELEWKPAVDPLHFDKPQIAGVGLGRAFAQVLSGLAPQTEIGLVPAAMGGSALSEWNPGDKLYTDAVARAKEAMKRGRLRGILWHQGEADAAHEDLARTYRDRWTRFITALRSELGAPDVPVVVGQLGEFLYKQPKNGSPLAKTVNEQLATIPLVVPHTAFVPSNGLNHKGDIVHFDAPGLREFGRRYAYAFLMLDPSWAPPGH